MIQSKAFFTIVCDSCGADALDGEEVSGWSEPDFAWDVAEEMGYIEHDGKHYCMGCFRYNDETDEVEIIENKEPEL